MSFKTFGAVLINGERNGEVHENGETENRNLSSMTKFDKNFDSLLILERSLERSGQQWVENLNVIEQHLVDIVESIGQEQPLLKANFILRRLPMYTTSFTNKNEYAVVLNNIPFSLLSPRRHSTIERNGPANFGQIELFHHQTLTQDSVQKSKEQEESESQNPKIEKCIHDQDIWSDVVNESNAFCSHEIFKKFASSFVRVANKDNLDDSDFSDDDHNDHDDGNDEKEKPEKSLEAQSKSKSKKIKEELDEKEKVQLIGPHLLHNLKTNREVSKIFTLTPTVQIPTPLSKSQSEKKKAQCRISINYLKSFLLISYEGTEVIVRPCLFHDQGYTKVNTNILERIPLFHTNILNICDGLCKGTLFFPTSFDTLWTFGFWPAESHLLCVYHPSSLVSRLFKLYSAFCINPGNFWEGLNNCFLIGMDDMSSLTMNMMDSLDPPASPDQGNQSRGPPNGSGSGQFHGLTLDFLFSSFLYEMEKYSNIEDWAPRNFHRRFMSLLSTSVDAYVKGFHAHYFTRINILRGMWKDSVSLDLDHLGLKISSASAVDTPSEFGREESSVLKELDDIEEYPEDNDLDHGEISSVQMEKSRDYLDNDDSEDYGLHFDSLETTDIDDSEAFSSLRHHHHQHQHHQHRENLHSASSSYRLSHNTPLTSDMVYRSVNPFQSMDNLQQNSDEHGNGHGHSNQNGSLNPKKSKTLSKMFGSNLLRKFTQLGRSQSDADAHAPQNQQQQQRSQGQSRNEISWRSNNNNRNRNGNSSRSMADITSGFEESVAQNRREQSLHRHLITPQDAETSFSVPGSGSVSGSTSGTGPRSRSRSNSVPSPRNLNLNNSEHNSSTVTVSNNGNSKKSGQGQQRKQHIESIYSNILSILKDVPPSDHLSDSEVVEELERSRKVLESQDELIQEWSNIMNELPTPKTVCPHTFIPRQIQYISLVIQKTSQCSPSAIKLNSPASASSHRENVGHVHLPAWEISGDLLRTVLHQMRSEPALCESFKEKHPEQMKPVKRLSLKSFKAAMSPTEKRTVLVGTEGESSSQDVHGHGDHVQGEGQGQGQSSSPTISNSLTSTLKKLSFKRRHSDTCTGHLNPQGGSGNEGRGGDTGEENDLAGETQFAMEEPETAATNRLLQWLWQLKTSDIGRLSSKAKRYLELLHKSSFQNSHFLEQFSEEKIFQTMAIRSAVAVSRIMADEKFPAYVPLLAASKKGWLWSEMILSLASWNKEKGFPILADVPIGIVNSNTNISTTPNDEDDDDGSDEKNGALNGNGNGIKKKRRVLLRDIYMSGVSIGNTLKRIKNSEPDAEAVTLAFHSELATPLGWWDFEDPRRPGPFTVPILIFSSLGYFKQWEMSPGNIVQVLIRLQRFNNLQHVGAALFPPHRKTALNEVRKLNKSLSFRTFQFDENVMSKTFKRLASLRSTRKLFSGGGGGSRRKATAARLTGRLYTCKDLGCANNHERDEGDASTKISYYNGKEYECTRL